MSCLFEVPTDTTATEAADADSEPTKFASLDGTEAVFVAGGIDTSVAETPEEGDVEDTPVRTSCLCDASIEIRRDTDRAFCL